MGNRFEDKAGEDLVPRRRAGRRRAAATVLTINHPLPDDAAETKFFVIYPTPALYMFSRRMSDPLQNQTLETPEEMQARARLLIEESIETRKRSEDLMREAQVLLQKSIEATKRPE